VATFVRSVIIDAPVESVFEFHERPDALRLLSPLFPPIRVVQRIGGIEKGARVELRVGFQRWEALHTEYEPNQFFVDKQVEGPFKRWTHRHEFEDLGDTTRLTDRVDYALPGGPLANLAFGWVAALGLTVMFRHRHKVTKRYCEKAAAAS
jgi:ligand-binding SRPBCC domain-containing protein